MKIFSAGRRQPLLLFLLVASLFLLSVQSEVCWIAYEYGWVVNFLTVVFTQQETPGEVARDENDDVKMPQNVHILYCVGWGMKKSFLSVKKYIEEEFPSLAGKVTGSNYPAPPIIELFSWILTGAQLLTMGFIIFGDNLWINILRFRQVPRWYYEVKQYGFQVGIGIFFVLPQFINRFIVTGAFEVLVDGEVGYSKLQVGKMPNAGDIMDIFTKIGMTAVSR